MLKPVAASITAKTASWNQLTPKYHRYNGTAVSVRTNEPTRNELVGILESVNNTSFRGVVRRHLHFHSITNRKPNETFAHLSGNMRKNQTLVCERDAKHGSGQHHHNGALQLDRFLRIHHGYVSGRGD